MINISRRNLYYFLFSDFLVQFGSGMLLTAIGWFILEITKQNIYVGLFFNLNVFFGVIASAYIGKIIDKYNKKKLLIWINMFRALTIAISLLLFWANKYSIYYIPLLALGNGVGWNAYYPVSKSILPKLIKEDTLVKVNSMSESVMQLGLFASGALSGIVYKLYGFKFIMLFNIACYFIAIFCISKIEITENDSCRLISHVSIKEAVNYLKSNVNVFFIGLAMYIPFAAATCINVSLPGYVSEVLCSDSVTFGIIDMLYGLGACFSGGLIMSYAKKVKTNIFIVVAYVLVIICGILLVFSSNVCITGIVMISFGMCCAGIRIILNAKIMDKVPENIMGRVMAIWNFLGLLLQILISSLAGVIMDIIAVSYGFILYSIIMCGGLLIYCLTLRGKK